MHGCDRKWARTLTQFDSVHGNQHFLTTQQDLIRAFRSCGSITRCHPVPASGIAFVSFATKDEADAAVALGAADPG